jgi:hypothetical protein
MRAMFLTAVLGATILSSLGSAQAPAPNTSTPGERLTFEVASIRRNTSGDQGAQIRLHGPFAPAAHSSPEGFIPRGTGSSPAAAGWVLRHTRE